MADFTIYEIWSAKRDKPMTPDEQQSAQALDAERAAWFQKNRGRFPLSQGRLEGGAERDNDKGGESKS